MHETTRRRFVAGALTTGAAAALPGAAEAKKHRTTKKRHRTRTADVCVVGAGFAGLTAARNLVNAGKTVVVLEARGVVGGRVQNHELGGGQVSERGGTFIGPTQDHVAALAKELGVDTFDTYDTGDNVYLSGGNRIDLQRHRPDRHRAAGPGDPAGPRRSRAEPRLDGRRRCRSTRRGPRPRRPSGTGRRSRPGSRPTAVEPEVPAARRRSRRGRSSAPSRASCRCCSCSSTSPRPATRRTRARSSATSTRATAGRCRASSAARS